MAQVIRLRPKEPEHLVRLDRRIRDKTNWTQVLDEIEKAKNAYSNVDNRFEAGFRRVYRKFGDHAAEPLNRMFKLVPSGGDLGSVAVTPIVGCVQILLEAARAASTVRKNMNKAFDDLEKMFSDIELFLHIYPEDVNIEKASIDLIASTLHAAENVLGFLTKGSWKKLISATVQRENYERDTIESLADVKIKCGLLLEEAKKSNMYQVFHSTKINTQGNRAMLETVERISRDQVRPHELRNIVHELLDEYETRWMLHLEQEGYRRRKENERLRVAFCLAAAQAVSQPSPSYYPLPQFHSSSMTQCIITPKDLLDWIAVPDLLAQDLQHIEARRKVQVTERDQARAEQLIRTGQIRDWLIAPTSTQLLVHGNYGRTAYISGLTLFCMSLTTTLAERNSRFIPLTFFCGLHTEPSGIENHTGGRAIIQSFIVELIQRFDFGSIQMPTLQCDDNKIRMGDVDELCKLFEALIRVLPNHVVIICLIDGIMYYERDEFKNDMAVVLSAILKLSADRSIAVPVKVLITSPTKTAEVRQPFPDNLILSMDAMAPAGMVASSSRLGREFHESGIM
ncbi:hypothetical protein N0V82_006923 [Gnomoniopsis sp. IMI 355080]|nr:hypothetical protein N0V82_006923 [Gnomoniopsis sp. IMI 355080]